MVGLGLEAEPFEKTKEQRMAQPPRSRREESEYFVLLNMLKEADLQMKALAIAPEARETLLGLVDFCQADFNERFR